MKKFLSALALVFAVTFASAKESPWSAWRNAYTEFEKAEKLRDSGDYLNAVKGFQKALKLYDFVRQERPDWNQKVIQQRIADCKREVGKLQGFLTPVAPNVAKPRAPSPAVAKIAKPAIKVDAPEVAALKKKLADLELELQTLRQKEKSRRDLESEIALLIRDQHLARERQTMMEEKLRQAQKQSSQVNAAAHKELQDQLVQSKLECETLKGKLTEAENQVKKANAESEKLLGQRKFAESAIQATQDKLLRQERETADIRRAEEENRSAREKLAAELAESKKNYAQVETELKETQKQLALLQEKMRLAAEEDKAGGKVLAEENRTLSGKLNALQLRYDQLDAAFRDLRSRSSADQTLAEQMKSVAERSESVRRMLEKQQTAQEKQLKDLRKETTDQMAEISAQKARITTLENNLQTAVAQKDLLTERLRQRDAADYRGAADLAVKRKEWEAEKSKFQQEIATQKGELAKQERLLRDRDTQIKTLTQSRDGLVAEKSAFQQEIARLTAIEAQVVTLQRNFGAAQKELQSAHTALKTAEKEHQELLALRQAQKEIDKLKAKISEADRLAAELADANVALTARLTAALKLKAEVEKLRAESAKIPELRAAIERLKKLNQELAKYRDLEKELATAKQTIIALESLQGQLAAAKKQQLSDQQKIDTLQQSLSSLTAKEAEMEKALAAEKSQGVRLQQDGEKSLAAKQKEIESLQMQLSQLRAAGKEETERLQQKLSQLRAGKEAELAALQSDLKKSRTEREAELAILQSDLKKSRTEKDDGQKLLKEREKFLKEREKQLVAEAEKARLAQEEMWREKLLAAQKKEEALQAQCRSLQKELGALQLIQTQEHGKFTEVEKALQEARGKNLPLQTQIDQLHAQIAELKKAAVRFGQIEEKTKLAEKEIAQLRALNQKLITSQASGKEVELLKNKLAEAEIFQREVERLRALNVQLRRENRDLELAVLHPEENVFQFDSTNQLLETPEVLVASGMRAEKENRLSTAIWNYENVLKKMPDHAFAAKRLGILLLRREQFERAAAVLKIASRLAPKDPEIAVAAARANNACQHYGSALVYLEPYLRDARPGMEVLLAASDALTGSGKRAKAEEVLQMAIRFYPNDFAPSMALAKLLADDPSREEESLYLYERLRVLGAAPEQKLEIRFAGRLDERRELAHFLNAAAEEAANRNEWAAVVWYRRQAAEMKRNESLESAQLAFARYMNGETAAALEELSLHRASIEGELVAALCHLRNGDHQAFQASLARAKSLNKNQWIELAPQWRQLLIELRKCALQPDGKSIGQFVR